MRFRLALFAVLAAAFGGAWTGVAAQVRVSVVAKGDVGQYSGMCEGAAGTDSLSGVLVMTSLDDDGSAFYMGKLARTTDVDACGLQPAPSEDQVVTCLGHLTGSAAMKVTLEVYEDDRGAWLKSQPVSNPLPSETVTKTITGCQESRDYLAAYPDDGWMSGMGLETVPSGPLAPGRYTTEGVTLTVY